MTVTWFWLVMVLAATILALPTNEIDPHELMAAMEKHDRGIVHLGDDGVLRSFGPNGTVLEYVKLSTNQIQQMLDRHGRNDHFTEVFDGVDGREVTDLEQLTNPGEDLLPKFPFMNSTDSAGVTNASSIQNQTFQGTSETHAPTSDNPMTGVSRALQGRGDPHGIDTLVAAAAELTISTDRVCWHISCHTHYHCFGMHPACQTCLYVDGFHPWGRCTQ